MNTTSPPDRPLGNVPWVMLLVAIEVAAHTVLGLVTDSGLVRVGVALLVGFLAFLPMRHRIWSSSRQARGHGDG